MNINSEFPEAFYIPSTKNLDTYLEKTNIGFERASRSSCFIISLMRDCESIAPYTLSRLNKLAGLFNRSHIHIYENDSNDNTPQIIKQWSGTNLSFISEKLGSIRGNQDYSFERRKRMAECRNRCFNTAKQYNLSDYDYLIIYDGDIEGGFSYHGVMNSLGYDNWHGIGSNSIIYGKTPENQISRLYYDIWATRMLDDDGERFYSQEKAEKMNLLRWERGEEPFEVLSCFGGLAVYKTPSVPLHYSDYDVDHMTLHTTMRKQGYRIFLNPSMITLYNSTFYMGNDYVGKD